MSSAESKPRELSTEEISTALEWIDGELEPEAANEFELRMSQDGELARQVEALTHIDAFMRHDARARAGSRRPTRPWKKWVALAAAGIALIAVIAKFSKSGPPECELALAPSFALAEDWVNQQPGLEGASAPGIAVSRGPNPRPMSAADFLDATRKAEAAVVAAAFADHRRQIEAGWFVVPVDLRDRAWVLVLSFPESGAPARLFPDPMFEDKLRLDSLVAKGRSLLPSDRAVMSNTPGTLDYRPGFLVPLGARQLNVLVAVHGYPDGIPLGFELGELDGWLAEHQSADQVESRLKQQGFAVQRLSVREPK